jgi:hypothetical protein
VSLYDSLAGRSLTIEEFEFTRLERETSSGFTRVSTVVELFGDGEIGAGEDVTYTEADHEALYESQDVLYLAGVYDFDGFSELLDSMDLFPDAPPERDSSRHYRRWAFESAALDLALKQDDTDLATALGREYDPVRFLVSNRLGDPPSVDQVSKWLGIDPTLEFKLDPTAAWSEDLFDQLRATHAVRILDLKGHYADEEVAEPPNPELYQRVVDTFSDVLIEDPKFNAETKPVLSGHENRLSWDYPITDVDSIEALPIEPQWLNVKPSRFGSVENLLETIEYCEEREINMYGGGQMELGVGREHLHALASIFYPGAPNDVAPSGYNDPTPTADLPSSPLQPPAELDGLEWSS